LRGCGTPSPPSRIEHYCSLQDYDWQAFLELLIEVSRFVPCPLCGQQHALRVHALLGRKVRSPEQGENIEIAVISIICGAAKEEGKQYSKRILPPFVIPYCQVGREGVLAYLKRFPDGRVNYAAGLEMLGARDIRTIRRHIEMGLQTLAAASLLLASLLSELPAYAALPEDRVGEAPRQYLERLAQEADRAAQKAGGRAVSEIPPLVYAHLLSVFERSPGPLAVPLSSVLGAALFPDTS